MDLLSGLRRFRDVLLSGSLALKYKVVVSRVLADILHSLRLDNGYYRPGGPIFEKRFVEKGRPGSLGLPRRALHSTVAESKLDIPSTL